MYSIYTYSQLASVKTTQSLSNLGKATRRGIKKCPKCGIFNGNRGLVCKNKQCDEVLKDYAEKKKVSLDAIRLTGIARQVYSVKVRDRGPDYRGFVQLPLLPLLKHDKNILSENALCFVDSCQRLFDDSILKSHEWEQKNTSSLCNHIDSAIKSQNEATPIKFNKEMLSSLNISVDVKAKLWLLLNENEGPLIQRVSRTVMVVKCQVSPKHPLGYLHFTFGSTKRKEIYDKYYCSCTEFMVSGITNKSNNVQLKCIHYYACICALASDAKYSQEFVYFTNLEFSRQVSLCSKLSLNVNYNLFNSLNNEETIKHSKHKLENRFVRRSSKRYKKIIPNIYPVEIKVLKNTNQTANYDTSKTVSWKFDDWLIYVTESINQTMEFENYGNVNSLIFCIPEDFYEQFKKKIPAKYKENNDASQVYRIMNILHLKEIFDTSNVKLKLCKRFIHDNQKGYVEYEEHDNIISCQSSFIFFLNVGQSTVDDNDDTNNTFLIEWTPGPSEFSKVGRLKLEYKYGRKNTTN